MSRPSIAWNEIFKHKGKVFSEPHDSMASIAKQLNRQKAKNILDLGCGSGRHVVYFARKGFSVTGLDNSQVGIEIARQWLAEEGLSADLRLQNMEEELPYEDAFFDAVISVQAIHHARVVTIRKIVSEIWRVLRQGGFLFITVPTLRNQASTFKQIEPNTYVPLDGPEKGLAHHYFTEEELRTVFKSFDINQIHIDNIKHFCVSASKAHSR